MLTASTVRTAVAVAAVAGLCTTGVASAATVPRAGTATVGSLRTIAPPVTMARIQGGSTGSGGASESDCQKIGDAADAAATKSHNEMMNGDVYAAWADAAAAQAIVSSGMDGGCFFWGLPW
jgi:hypothetical protein